MEKIIKVWFNQNRIFIKTDKGRELSRPLEALPRLLEATDKQREGFRLGVFGDDIRWEEVDEDIHIHSFFLNKEPDHANSIALAFSRFPELNVSQVAQSIGINKSLMSHYIYGIKTPSPERKKQIEEALHRLGRDLMTVSI